MCTVVYIPSREKKYFASLRDESPARPAAWVPKEFIKDGKTCLAPKDPVAGGTWIGVNESGNAVILLNGGFENHQPKPGYRKSRGIVANEFLLSSSAFSYWEIADLQDIEPFTLIIWENEQLSQLVWDGNEKHRLMPEVDKPHIWSSSTLYELPAKKMRKALFDQWARLHPSILDFFKSFEDIENGFLVNRNEKIKTVSYTFIELTADYAEFDYIDFSSGKYSNSRNKSCHFAFRSSRT